MADGLQVFNTGQTPSATTWNKVARRVVIDGSTSYILGLIPNALEGQHFWDTTLHRGFYWDGSNLYPNGLGRAIRSQYVTVSALTASNNTERNIDFQSGDREYDEVADADRFISDANLPGHVFHATYEGQYNLNCSVYFTGQVGAAGNWLKFTRGGSFNDYIRTWVDEAATEAHLGIPNYNMLSGDTFKFSVKQTTGGDLNFTARVSAMWTGK